MDKSIKNLTMTMTVEHSSITILTAKNLAPISVKCLSQWPNVVSWWFYRGILFNKQWKKPKIISIQVMHNPQLPDQTKQVAPCPQLVRITWTTFFQPQNFQASNSTDKHFRWLWSCPRLLTCTLKLSSETIKIRAIHNQPSLAPRFNRNSFNP